MSMELAAIVIASAIILMVLFIVLAQIASLKKTIAGLQARPARDSEFRGNNDRGNNRGYDRRPNRDGQQRDSRPPRPQQAAAPSAAPEAVDTSLRDINLKLKNAELNQERARQNLGRDGNQGDRPQRSNNDRPQRGGNDRDRSGRDRPRGGNNRGDYRNRNDRPSGNNYSSRPPMQNTPFEGAPPAAESVTSAPVTPVATPDEGDFSVEKAVQHDRRVTVKRRSLDELLAAQDAAAAAKESSQAQPTASEQPQAAPETPASNQEISFGRR